MWKPVVVAGRGAFLELLAEFVITPSTRAIHEAVFDLTVDALRTPGWVNLGED
jgi:hypothetical protein